MKARYLFVGGLHRSGTSLAAEELARHPKIAAIEGAPVPENEGVYLQGAIPHTAGMGRPGRFAEDPAMHLIEGGSFDTLAVRERLAADWAPWFPPDAPWRLEKSPVNLLRARLYQQLFPTTQFVFVVRHPLAVGRATAKWSDRSEAALIAHWVRAHALLIGDLPHLHCWAVLRYEDLCADPAAELSRIWRWMELGPPVPAPSRGAFPNSNAAYLAAGPAPETSGVDPVWSRFGYALDRPDPVVQSAFVQSHYYRSLSAP